MKNTLVLLLFAALSQSVFGQNKAVKTTPPPVNIDEAAARSTTDVLALKYSLNADQAKQMYQIQVRKLRNLAEIEPLRSSNPVLFSGKVESIQQGTLSSIRRILQSKTQVDIFKKTQSEQRTARAAKRKELTLQGTPKEAIDAVLLGIYQE